MIAVFAAIRAVHFASLMLVFGACAYLLLLQTRLRLVPKCARMIDRALPVLSALALITGIVWLCLATGMMSGDWRASLHLSMVERAVAATHFGHVFVCRIVLLLLLPIAALALRARRMECLFVLSGLLLASLSLTSHAAASAEPPAQYFRALNDAAHLLAAGFWIGALAALALMIPEHRGAPAGLLPPVRLFSVWGVYAVAILVASGVVNALCLVDVRVFRLDAYRVALALKIALAAAMILLAILNRWRFAPALRDDPAAPRAFARTVAAELALGVLVIGIVGILGLLPPE